MAKNDAIQPIEPIMESTDVEPTNEERSNTLFALGLAMQDSRLEAIKFRQSSGVEAEWLEDQEYYEGIDDTNRAEVSGNWKTKPPGQGEPQQDQPRSTVFPNITRPYCDSAAARVGDAMLPTDDKAWALKSTPVIELTPIAEGKIPPNVRREIEAEQQIPAQDEQGNEVMVLDEEGVERTTADIIDFAKKEMETARASLEKAERRIDDWHVECQYHAEVRKVIDAVCQSGSGILKGPIPQKRRYFAYDKASNGLIMKEEIKPGSVWTNHWDFYPDPACGENLHNGDHCWEKDKITAKALKDLIGTPGYFEEEIDFVLAQGPMVAEGKMDPAQDAMYDNRGLLKRDDSNLFDIWYFHGHLDKTQAKILKLDGVEDMPDTVALIPAQITMVNNRPIKVVVSPMDDGELPYDMMVWQKRKGSCWGIGVARQVRTPQDIVKGALRLMMDNAGVAGGPQIIIQRGIVEAADGVAEIKPMKVWVVSEDADLKDLDNAFRFVTIPMLQTELQAIFEMGMRLAEEVTGMPMLMQGQRSSTTPDTLGGQKMQEDNSSTVLRRFARLFDDMLTEPHIRRYYSYLLQYGEDDEKGEFVVDARGSSALVERDIHNRELMELGEMIQNPIFGLDPKKWAAEVLKSKRLDVRRFEYSDDEWQKIVEQLLQAQQPTDSSVEVATVKGQFDLEKQGMVSQDKDKDRESKEQITAVEISRDEATKARTDEVMQSIEAAKMYLVKFKAEGDRQTNVEKMKVDLTKHLQTITAQIKMHDGEIATPVVEPAPRAAAGKSFAQ